MLQVFVDFSISWILMCLFFSTLLWLLTFLFMKDDNSMGDNEPFECGLEAFHILRFPLRMHFFLIGIMFLVFDIEFVVSLPLIIVCINLSTWLVMWVLLMALLFIGLLMEIILGTLDWKE